MTDGVTNANEPVMVPCDIFVTFRDHGGPFQVKDVGAWQYTDNGVFATGSWALPRRYAHECYTAGVEVLHEVVPPTEDVLIPYDKINFIRFDWDALAAYQASLTEEVNDDGQHPTTEGYLAA